jgi:hypothetical protein
MCISAGNTASSWPTRAGCSREHTSKLRTVRFTTFRPGDSIPEAALVDLTREAAHLAAMSREERLALTLDRDGAPDEDGQPI